MDYRAMRHYEMKAPAHHSPWGQPDNFEQIAKGIWFVFTPSHGGIWLHASLRGVMEPLRADNFLKSTQWFEEDDDWPMVYAVFYDKIKADGIEPQERLDRNYGTALKHLDHRGLLDKVQECKKRRGL